MDDKSESQLAARAPAISVAVVGGGICGATTAYYLSQYHPQAQVTVFERGSQPGGRISDCLYRGVRLALGASYFMPSSPTLTELGQAFGLSLQPPPTKIKTLVAWNGRQTLYDSSDQFAYFWFLWRYGYSGYKLNRAASSALEKLDRVYGSEQQGGPRPRAFNSPAELLQKLGLADRLGKRVPEICTELRLNSGFVRDILYGTIMSLFNDPLSAVGALPFLFTVKAISQPPLCFAEGASELLRRMLTARDDICRLRLGTEVREIIYQKEQERYTLKFRRDGAEGQEDFDIVVLAAPLFRDRIRFTNLEQAAQIAVSRTPKVIRSTIVEGRLNNGLFGRTDSAPPIDSLLLAEGSERVLPDLKALSLLHLFPDGSRLYKLQSSAPLSDKLLATVFEKFKVVESKAFESPQFANITTSIDQLPPFVLNRGLYFPGAMEFVASWLEFQALAGKNTAQLIAEHYGPGSSAK